MSKFSANIQGVGFLVLGHHEDRLEQARAFGATDLVSSRGEGFCQN